MRYAKIREMDISNGEGVGVSLFVQGCCFRCRGCFNPETWDFSGGKEWNDTIKHKFIEIANKPYIVRISILGGEPLCDENVTDVLSLVNELKVTYPDKKIWIYTGYNFDDIIQKGKIEKQKYWKERFEVISKATVVVDGQFQIENQDLYNEKIVFAGSTNQRIIHIQDYK